MKYYMFSLLDTKSDLFSENLYPFTAEKLGEMELRRSVRDLYIKQQVTFDWIMEHAYCCIGEYDTVENTFNSYGQEYVMYPCYSMIRDIRNSIDDPINY